MKKKLILLIMVVFVLPFGAQTIVSNLEDVPLPLDSFYNGSVGGSGFQSGNIFYPTAYDNSFQYWSSGFAVSNRKDSVTSGYTNLYSAKPSEGCLGSSTYAIAQNFAVAKLVGSSQQDSVYGFYVANSTYAYNSMRDGDAFAKKFGGSSGNDPDWFMLTVKKYFNGVLSFDSVYFYLADYRFSNNANDYILDSWQWVNCKNLGKADSLLFILSSSDVGQFGMNTPGFVAIDNITTKATFVGNNEVENVKIHLYPNPIQDLLTIQFDQSGKALFQLYDFSGKLIEDQEIFENNFKKDFSNLPSGSYLIKIISSDRTIAKSVFKY